MRISDWSSDVCSSDLKRHEIGARADREQRRIAVGGVKDVAREPRHPHAADRADGAADADHRSHRAARENVRRQRIEIGRERLVRGGRKPDHQHRDPDAVDRLREEDRQRSEEHTSELQSLMRISYAVFCLKKKNKIQKTYTM